MVTWKPVSEDGTYTDKEFDKRFEFDRIFEYESFFTKTRIRFVKYPDIHGLVTVYTTSMLKRPKFVWDFMERHMSFAKYIQFVKYSKKFASMTYVKQEIDKHYDSI